MACLCCMSDTISYICFYSCVYSINMFHSSSFSRSFSMGLSLRYYIPMLYLTTNFVTTIDCVSVYPNQTEPLKNVPPSSKIKVNASGKKYLE